MPPPLIYSNAVSQKVVSQKPPENSPFNGVLYVTDRAPIDIDNRIDKFQAYSKERNAFLSVGINSVVLNQYGKNQLSVSNVETFGVLKSVLPFGQLTDVNTLEQASDGGKHLVRLIDKKLALSKQKDIFIYVHGAQNSFDSPPLVAAELWHYLSYEGVMMNYLWPATTARFGYFKDTENAQISGYNLAKLIRYLADQTKTGKIHLLSHSAGGRVVVTALRELAVLNENLDDKLGNVMLVASDLNPSLFGMAISDGITDLTSRLTVYVSPNDTALSLSSFLFKGLRLGQVSDTQVLSNHIVEFFDQHNIDVIDVSAAPKISALHGHSYFRSSPWVSSDVISVLRFGLRPQQRRLRREQGQLTWQFPQSYAGDIKKLPLNKIIKK